MMIAAAGGTLDDNDWKITTDRTADTIQPVNAKSPRNPDKMILDPKLKEEKYYFKLGVLDRVTEHP